MIHRFNPFLFMVEKCTSPVLPCAIRFLIGLAMVASTSLATAQDLKIDWFRIGGGGGASSGSNYTVIGNVGQFEAGSLAAGNFKLDGGFWPVESEADGGLPTITTQPQSEQVPLGTTATFTVVASSATPLSYQWRLNGADLPGATGAVLVLTDVQASDAGDYTVEVSNAFGGVTSVPATLIVLFPPSITLGPITASVLPGALVNFIVVATGSEPLTYQWRLNGVNLPGATASTLTILSAQVLNGGSYSVVVANAAGAVTSDPAGLFVFVPPVPPGDNFVDRVSRVAPSGAVSGTNLFATREPGEPNHAGQPGGRSVWYSWTALVSGVATFNTVGSTFDTLLAVYTGTVVSNLTAVASDDDSGGFFTSAVTFNAVAGTQYQIAIDGFGGAAGTYILSWTLLPGVEPIPVITSQPLSQTVVPGANVTFTVAANGAFYQWLFNGAPINGATGPSLTRSKVQSADAGAYVVRVSNNSGRSILSSPAILELARLPASLSQDKFEDLFVNAGSGNGGPFGGPGGKLPLSSAANGPGTVTAGTLNSQILNNINSTTEAGEPNHCGVIGGASRWVKLTAGSDGIFVIDTIGSTFDTVLAVYTGTNLLTLNLVTCDNNGAPDGIRSLVRFNATNRVDYLVAVDGVNGAQGTIQLNWGLGIPPTYAQPPTNVLAPLGGSVTLNAQSATGIPTPSFQWLASGSILLGANNSTMTLNNIQLADAGPYSVVLSNFTGSATGMVANVTVVVPLDLMLTKVQTNGISEFRLTGTASHGFVLQASTNLANWLPLFTNPTPGTPLNFLDVSSTNFPMRFYRAMPWP